MKKGKFKYAQIVLRQKILRHEWAIKNNPYHISVNMWQSQIDELKSAIRILTKEVSHE